MDGFGCGNLPLAIRAAGGILQYLKETQKGSLSQLNQLNTYSPETFMALDLQTQNNLELFRTAQTGKSDNSLLSVIDLTQTPMGGRLIRKWLGQPLLNLSELESRQDAVGWFFNDGLARKQITTLLGDIPDLERLINRVKGNLASPRELALCGGVWTWCPRSRPWWTGALSTGSKKMSDPSQRWWI